MGDNEDIYRHLDELSKSKFKRFRQYLNQDTLPGFTPIPWGLLEKKDVTDIVQLMKERYGIKGRMKITQHILRAMGHQDPSQQLQQTSADFSTNSSNQTVSEARTGVTQDIHTLGLGTSEAGNRISSSQMSVSNTSTPQRRKWNQCSKRWHEQMEALVNMEDSKVRRVGNLIFVPKDEKFRMARTGQAEVLLGLKKDGTEVAIKKMLIFQDELERLLEYRFTSLHVVQYVDSEEVDDVGYIAMQLCDYNLQEYLKEKNPDELERRRIVKEFLEGLKVLHEHDLIHRDIKPQNILIYVDGGVRLSDFGISRTLEPGQTTRVTSRAGTECWEATEVLRTRRDQGIRYKQSTDIQVAGMLVYYILSGGKHPFGDDEDCEDNIKKCDYKLDDLNDEEAKDLVKSMLNVDPEARPRITEVLSHPNFWDDKRKESFLKEVGDVPEVQKHEKSCKDEHLQKVLKELEVDKKSFSTWKKLGHVTDEDMKEKWSKLVQDHSKDKDPETLLCLLRFIRNRWRHQPERMEEISVMKLFPDLVVTAYKLDKKRGWNVLPTIPSVKRKAESSSSTKVGGHEPDAPPQKKTKH
ncbi:uncharacterized protein LOC134099035 [Sardina pilchardus]|uniref:uncharacterized protein LOC134099035 n=1 Tax=Sardina pilchardus TaxID=27697 RepID=UPI002E0DD104